MKSHYTEAVNTVRSWITKRQLPPGSSLPSSRSLAEQFGFKLSTMELACKILVVSGFLSRDGYKLFVGNAKPSQSPIAGFVYVVSYLEVFNKNVERILTERGVKHRSLLLSWMRHQKPTSALRKIVAEKPDGIILGLVSNIPGPVIALETGNIPMVICSETTLNTPDHSTSQIDLSRGAEIAVRHLFHLGHRHIAHLFLDNSYNRNAELAVCFRNACLKLNLKSSAATLWPVKEISDCQEVIRRARKRHPEVTAIFTSTALAAVVGKIFRVPEELSVIAYGSSLIDLMKDTSPLTAVGLRDSSCGERWGCAELIFQIQAIQSGRPPRPPIHALFVPDLIVRGSTRALTAKEQSRPSADANHSPGQSLPDPKASWNKVYPFLKRNKTHRWRQLDLTPLANHSLTRSHGWLGWDPLLHFPPGLHSIHGAPFHVLDETRHGGRAVITFRSPYTHSAKGKELPTRVEIPVGERVRALYFLHGCGHAQGRSFADYIVHFKKGKKASKIPLVSLCVAPATTKRPGKLRPNIQDWWPGFEHRDFPHARYAIVSDPTNPGEYTRYLYTLEWINPRPDDEVQSIEIQVDPAAGPALALIAVTALLSSS